MLFCLQTSYLVPRYNPIRRIQWPKCQRSRSIFSTRGQHPNESQKAVIIDMMRSVGEIASEIWTVLWFFTHFFGKFDLDLWHWPWVKVISTWVNECALLGCTLEPCMKSVDEIASEIWPALWCFTHFWTNLTLTFDLKSKSSALGSLNAPYWVVPWY